MIPQFAEIRTLRKATAVMRHSPGLRRVLTDPVLDHRSGSATGTRSGPDAGSGFVGVWR
ncbi:hypothetical protein GCM10018785_18430 [Streptomyces longispororuber]|uniref:Uncharacterized protein n=1 Tax=Streptomyces longispororuber TaxID=68230 RepID=A0A918ZFV0_9ACTN|nr:hypothetical protein [Streptomyces longispororuber]GHE49190.1 hypothetical protein GCM10018785_18430 [Streptomyces longispororuber]